MMLYRCRSLASSALMLSTCLVLAACGDGATEVDRSEQGGEVSGDVLGGSTSDNMIPLEQLQSTSPLARNVPGEIVAEEDEEASEESNADAAEAEVPGAPTTEAEAPADAPAPDALPVAPPVTPTVAPPLDDG